MEISSVSNPSYQPMSSGDPMAKMKQLFQNLGNALDSGNLSDAKDALAQLQKNAPALDDNGKNPVNTKVEKLARAVETGDLKSAKDAYADIKKTMSQGPGSQGPAGGSGGASPGGAKQSSGASSSSSSKKDYDKKDLNKDGTVSTEEELIYALKHPQETKKDTSIKNDQGPMVDTTA